MRARFGGAKRVVMGERMKARCERRVPLSKRALAIVKQLSDVGSSEFVIPWPEAGQAAAASNYRLKNSRTSPNVTVLGATPSK